MRFPYACRVGVRALVFGDPQSPDLLGHQIGRLDIDGTGRAQTEIHWIEVEWLAIQSEGRHDQDVAVGRKLEILSATHARK